MSQKCEAFVETGNFRDFSDGIVKELSVYMLQGIENIVFDLGGVMIAKKKISSKKEGVIHIFHRVFHKGKNRYSAIVFDDFTSFLPDRKTGKCTGRNPANQFT